MNAHPTPNPAVLACVRRPQCRRLLRATLLLALAAPALARPARAWETPAESTLATSPDARSMRAALERLARSAAKGDPRLAGQALYWKGVSAAREGLADTAIVSFQRAAALFPFDDQQLALADAWMARGKKADLEDAAALMLSAAPFADVNEDRAPFRGRLGWSLFLAGQTDSALAVFRPVGHFLAKDLVWRERMGRSAEAAHDWRLAGELLRRVVVETRGADRAAVESLHRTLGQSPDARATDLDAYLRQKIAEQEATERRAVEAFGGKRLHLQASDGFPLGAALFVPSPKSPVAVFLMASGDSLALYDSLATRMNESGLAALLVERRGSGASVGPGLAISSDTYGREEALENRIARDAVDALRAAARLAPIDTTRVVIGGVGDGALTVIRAAALLPHSRALLLLSPSPSLIQLGPSRARLAKLQRPAFIQLAMDEGYMFHDRDIYMDALYRSGDAARSRVVEARLIGGGPTLFRRDPSVWPRIEQWLHEALSAPHATRPAPPRKG
jgi:predicted alpha/beta hydrolase